MKPCGIKDPWFTQYPNSELGNRVAWELFQRGMQMSLCQELDAALIVGISGDHQSRLNDARGPVATAEVLMIAEFTSNTRQTSWIAFAQVMLICESSEYSWQPNWSGSNLCVDGVNFFRLEVRYPDGEVSLRKDGDQVSVPRYFRRMCSRLSWKAFRD